MCLSVILNYYPNGLRIDTVSAFGSVLSEYWCLKPIVSPIVAHKCQFISWAHIQAKSIILTVQNTLVNPKLYKDTFYSFEVCSEQFPVVERQGSWTLPKKPSQKFAGGFGPIGIFTSIIPSNPKEHSYMLPAPGIHLSKKFCSQPSGEVFH